MSTEQHISPSAIVTKAGVGVDGPGYLGGEHPAGRTTVNGTPVSADVDVFHELDTKDWQHVASTTSQPDGTWSIVGLNPDKKFNVVARHASFGGVIAVDVQPSRTDVVTLSGAFTNNEDFNGVDGFMTVESGMPPFTASVVDPLPYGLTPLVVDGRKLIIDGTTTEVGLRNAQITVGDSAGNSAVIPVEIPLGMDAPSGIEGEYDADNNLLTIGWTINSHVEQSFNIYRSAAAIDPDDLPAPIGTVAAGISEFVDDDVVLDAQYYYAVAAVRGDAVRVSASEKIRASSATFDTFMADLGPLAWWKLDDEASGPVQDHSVNGLHGSLTDPERVTFRGPPLRKGHPGAMGFCVASAGIARVDAPSNTAISGLMQPGNSATISMYVHRTAFTTFNFTLAFFTNAGYGNAKYRIYSRDFIFEARDNANQVASTGMNLLNETYFVVARKDVNNSKYDLFVNGVWFASAMPFTQPSLAGGGPLQFPGSAFWNYYGMRGYMSDVALFDRALTDAEIGQLYLLGAL